MPTPTPPLRRWLRFSLRTLLLFVLLIGSSATLWWNWGPWRIEHKIELSPPVEWIQFATTCDYTPGDKFIYAIVGRFTFEAAETIHFYDSSTGKSVLTLSERRSPFISDQRSHFSISTGGNYVSFQARDEDDKLVEKLWRIDTGELIDFDSWIARQLNSIVFSKHDRFAMFSAEGAEVLVDMKSRQPVWRSPPRLFEAPNPAYALSEDEGWLVSYTDGDIEVIDARSGAAVSRWRAPRGSDADFSLSPNASKIVFNSNTAAGRHTLLCDMRSGTVLGDLEGDMSADDERAHYHRFSPNGKYLRIILNSDDVIWQIEPTLRRCLHPATNVLFFDSIAGDTARYYCGSSGGGENAWPEDATIQDLQTEAILFQHKREFAWTRNSDYAERFNVCEGRTTPKAVLDARTGRELFELSNAQWSSAGDINRFMYFARTKPDFITYEETRYDFPNGNATTDSTRVLIWHLTRPPQWYGPAYLPEFWLTLVLAAGFLWSVWRDRRLGTRP